MFRILFFIAVFIFLAYQVSAQRTGREGAEGQSEEQPSVEIGEGESRVGSSILNDTIQSIYGPTTSQYFHANSIKNNLNAVYTIDTSVYNLHQFSFVDYHNKKYQDLGVVGTAIRPIYFEFNKGIGRTTGYDAYELYFRDADQTKFYNTKSPYSRIGVVLGGLGRSLTEAEYSRNIDYRSNIGFSYRGIFIDEQFERERRGDRIVQGIYYNLHGNYHTINKKYWILASFIRNNHEVDEYGGILNGTPNTPFEQYFEDTVRVSLNGTVNRELRRQYYVYHEYHISDNLEVFHELQHDDQLVRLFSDVSASPENSLLPERILTESEFELLEDVTETEDRNKYDLWSNKLGLSGSVGPGFYKIYYQRRKMNFDYRYIHFDTLSFEAEQHENMAGAMLRIGDQQQKQIFGQFDYLEGGYYNFEGSIAYNPFYVAVRQMKRKPSLMETVYRGSFHEYNLDPVAPLSSEIAGGINLIKEKINLNVSMVYQRLTNSFYYVKNDSGRTVVNQNEGTVTAMLPQLQVSKWWGDHWLTSAEFIYAKVGGDNPETYPIPELFGNFQVSYNDISFDSNLEWQLGVEAHWKSSYLAPGYDPLLQQYFIQDEFYTPEAPIIDIFLNAKINRGRLFIKYINLFQAFAGYGHMPTPYYPGQMNTLDFGFNWSFYD